MKFIKLAASPDCQSLLITDDKFNVLFASEPCDSEQCDFLADAVLILLIRLGVLPKLGFDDKVYHVRSLLFGAKLTPDDCTEIVNCPDNLILSKPNYPDVAQKL